MKQTNMEQTQSNPTVIGDKEEKASYGKFNKVEDLVNAYNSLESEFTKRSQKLKELETKTTAASEWENKVQKLMAKYPIAAKFTDEIGEEIANKDMIKDENCLEKALLSVLCTKYKPPEEQAKDEKVIGEILKDETFKDRIIDEYRQKLNINLPKSFPKGGEIPVKTPHRPASIMQAGKLALELLNEI